MQSRQALGSRGRADIPTLCNCLMFMLFQTVCLERQRNTKLVQGCTVKDQDDGQGPVWTTSKSSYHSMKQGWGHSLHEFWSKNWHLWVFPQMLRVVPYFILFWYFDVCCLLTSITDMFAFRCTLSLSWCRWSCLSTWGACCKSLRSYESLMCVCMRLLDNRSWSNNIHETIEKSLTGAIIRIRPPKLQPTMPSRWKRISTLYLSGSA